MKFRKMLGIAALVCGMLWMLAIGVSAEVGGNFGNCRWTSANRVLTFSPVEGTDGKMAEGTGEYTVKYPWSSNKYIDKIVFEEGVKLPENCSDMFYGFSSLNEIDINKADFSDVKIMDDMFHYCSYLATLDLSGLNMSNVVSMENLLYDCRRLTQVNLTGVDTSSLENMKGMFAKCGWLETLDLSGLDTSSVTNMSGLFEDCVELKSLNLSGFATSSAIYMNEMFLNCRKLTPLDVTGFDTSNVQDMASMFESCISLTELDLSSFDTSSVQNMSRMFLGCYMVKDIDIDRFDTSSVTDMSYMFFNTNAETLDLSHFDTSSVVTMDSMFAGNLYIQELYISNFDTSSVTNMANMFLSCQSLRNIDVSHFDTSAVTSIAGMFSGCSSLTRLDFSNWKTFLMSNYLDYENCLEKCLALAEVRVGNNFSIYLNLPATYMSSADDQLHTTVVPYMSAIYTLDSSQPPIDIASGISGNCRWVLDGYGTLIISPNNSGNGSNAVLGSFRDSLEPYTWHPYNVDIQKVTFAPGVSLAPNSSHLFANLYNITEIDMSEVNTENVTNMYGMFSGCSQLRRLDLSGFNTQNVTDMGSMFMLCNNLPFIDASHFDTVNVTKMYSMFAYCNSLQSVDVSGFNTANVTSMSGMFENCYALKSLDLSSFNTSNVRNFDRMLALSTEFEELTVGSTFTIYPELPQSMYSSVNGQQYTAVVPGVAATYTIDYPTVIPPVTETEITIDGFTIESTDSNRYISGISAGSMTVSQLRSAITNTEGVYIFTVDGYLAIDSSPVCTGMTIRLENADKKALDIVTIVVTGDLQGDGLVDAADRTSLSRFIAGWSDYDLSWYQSLAMDINADDYVTARDRIVLSRHVAGWSDYQDLSAFAEK